mmetsp:Transcript_69331/g.62216  ORF Transcript_69331/g.62216 Transcript_69331/m.62216 type:complete len:105 (+) Transcript_69331:58-372(+)
MARILNEIYALLVKAGHVKRGRLDLKRLYIQEGLIDTEAEDRQDCPFEYRLLVLEDIEYGFTLAADNLFESINFPRTYSRTITGLLLYARERGINIDRENIFIR